MAVDVCIEAQSSCTSQNKGLTDYTMTFSCHEAEIRENQMHINNLWPHASVNRWPRVLKYIQSPTPCIFGLSCQKQKEPITNKKISYETLKNTKTSNKINTVIKKLCVSSILNLYLRIIVHLIRLLSDYVYTHHYPSTICQRLNMILRRPMFRKHDYIALTNKLHLSTNVQDTTLTIKMMLTYCNHLILRLTLILRYKPPYSMIFKQRKVSFSETSHTINLTGGGLKLFKYDEIQPYLVPTEKVNYNAIFKFKDYVKKSQLSAPEHEDQILYNLYIPLTQLSLKLTISQLRIVAACHGISTHSKMHISYLQSTICNHVCDNCETYVSVLEPVVKNEQIKQQDRIKRSNLMAVKKYQTLQGTDFKKANSIAVKSYQDHQGIQYKQANLSSVKFYQKVQGAQYKETNLSSVKEHQKMQGARYKQTNLFAVKEYQKKQGNQYRKANLKAVKDYHKRQGKQYKMANLTAVNKYRSEAKVSFPPSPPSKKLLHSVLTGACKEMSPDHIMEQGCAVCGKLTLNSELLNFTSKSLNLQVLYRNGATRCERSTLSSPIQDIDGPIYIKDLDKICKPCHRSISKGKAPIMSLTNGLWLGEIPLQLLDLTFSEQMLIARVRHNRCIIKVSSGMHKMRANAICFSNPTPKVYDVLPPPIEEMDDVLAFIYTGPCYPTKAEFERTPFLVRHKKVRAALDWLKLNHKDYYDLEISQRNLDKYPEDKPPVIVEYLESFSNKPPESQAVNDHDDDEGTEYGKCSFVVQGLTGDEYSKKSTKALKAIALKHLTSNNKILAIGHNANPESIYSNPQLFPQMMPWLFPYGLGGIGNNLIQGNLSDIAQKRRLLMYYDKRFQKDPHFPLIAFNHEQIKQCTTAGYLLAEKSKFEDISKRLLDVDARTLEQLIKKMEDGDKITPETDEERLCFQLIKDLDHVGGHVKGSMTSKKYMRNEIWSLISFVGAPSWFITFAPADNKHPISLYYADTQETFQPCIRDSDERYRLIAQNPVAGARFFHFMCEIFIKHVLGVGQNQPGVYGETEAYYGTVEQQGRLTLHIHMLLWIKGCLSPQEIRDRIMDPNSEFQKKMIEYLESVHIGEFLTGSMDEVRSQVENNVSGDKNYQDPTQTLPECPPPSCNISKIHCPKTCNECINLSTWWEKFNYIVDDLIFRSNIHKCRQIHTGTDKKDRPSCINKFGNCKARFPRQVYAYTEVDSETGALNVKKGEPWINTVTSVLTYLLRCNTDVTSLLSGTAIKAIVAYISDYITKTGLKTYSVFDAIRGVLGRNTEMLGGSLDRKEKARRLITQIVNSLTAKMEIGGPMASLYLLGNPDHYTSHQFVTVYWKNYVREVMKVWNHPNNVDDNHVEKLVLQRNKDRYVGIAAVYDYIYRPKIYNETTLYEWIQMARRVKKKQTNSKKKSMSEDEEEMYIKETNFKKQESTTSKDTDKIIYEFKDNEPDIESDGEDILSDNLSDEEDIDSDEAISEKITDEEMDCNTDHIVSEASNCFLKDHPLYDTHIVNYNTNRITIVPNFVGGSLPRRDSGDREYYCATMLTLFKPWRNGKDLKDEDSTWDKTFSSYNFSQRQLKLLDNFNIRYECNDARDDFSTQLKQNKNKNNRFSEWIKFDEAEEVDITDEDESFEDDEGIDDEDYGMNRYTTLGSAGRIVKEQMIATENTVRNAGWLDKSPDGITEIDYNPIKPDVEQTGNEWKIVIQNKRQEIFTQRASHIPEVKGSKVGQHVDFNENDVCIMDATYLNQNFQASCKTFQKIIDTIVPDFDLNVEQERAFRIVANHATGSQLEQLKMYLGGMGGTGKSQVIKCLKEFFNRRKESYRFVVLGPTGTASALLGGSTYHSFLGFGVNSGSRNSAATIAQVRNRLEGVNYIFIDEVSMLACHDLCKISSQLAKVLGVYDLPFGGINMIFAGDFAQLPPVGGAPLYSRTVGSGINSGLTLDMQNSAIGKAIWHQITTVVILKQNMRQRTQTSEDTMFRTALSNMRYGACTVEDIKFLKTRIAGKRSDQPSVASKNFRNIAIICGINSQKDIINQLGCERFAEDTGQKLTNFYSIDKWGEQRDPAKRDRKNVSKKSSKKIHDSNEIEFDDQLEIWKLHHGATDHFPGKLSLCLGMPVMIRNNDATELCITKGQEGFVVGWQSYKGPHGKRILDTLFVKLDNPPQDVHIPGLPENVIPLVKITKTITCTFPSDLKESVERQQVCVLPNFAMTAHAAQGKTRPFNVVHLNSCHSHMSYYTALSRSATADGTIIIQGFDHNVITRGCSGYLRQELRELEVLNDITRLRYEGHLPIHINESIRIPLIQQYQQWKGIDDIYPKVDSNCMSKQQTQSHLSLAKNAHNFQKKGEPDKQKTNNCTENSTKSIITAKKSKKHKIDATEISNKKKQKKATSYNREDYDVPMGLRWDGDNYSCAYDSLYTVLFNIWAENPERWTTKFYDIGNAYLSKLADGFDQVMKGFVSLEEVRDILRLNLHEREPDTFPFGDAGTSVALLAIRMLKTLEPVTSSQVVCYSCRYAEPAINDSQDFVVSAGISHIRSTSDWMQTLQRRTSRICPSCSSLMRKPVFYNEPPNLLVLEYPQHNIRTSHKLTFHKDDDQVDLHLKGIVYLGGFHFTACFISSDHSLWYHDGRVTGRNCIQTGNLLTTSDSVLRKHQNRILNLAIYAQNLNTNL
jgi:hypothetical protein